MIDKMWENNVLLKFLSQSVSIFNDILIEIRYPSDNFEKIKNTMLANMYGKLSISKTKIEVSVVFSNSTTYIEECAFYKFFFFLQEITIPDYITSIGRSVEMSNSVTSIEESAFYKCKFLQQIEIPKYVKFIDIFTFEGCLLLKQVVIPSSVTKIGVGAFRKCSSLVEIQIPSSVKFIKEYSFAKCTSLQKINIPSSVVFIGKGAFEDCPSLNLKIPSSLKKIRDDIYSNHSSLSKAVSCILVENIPADAQDVGEIFSMITEVRKFVILRKFSGGHDFSREKGIVIFLSPCSLQKIESEIKKSRT